ncbi:MAG: type II toxin-antitoxin system Phd/YefM family antitoxin [Vulcanimicrobiota bacterium]
MGKIGIFEVKTRLSELCEQVARTRTPIIVTRHGKPLVRILPLEEAQGSVWERREAHLSRYDDQESEEFQLPPRTLEQAEFTLDG